MFISVMGVVLAPVMHRIIHKFHLADADRAAAAWPRQGVPPPLARNPEDNA